MGRSCQICNSPFREEIDQYITDRKFKTIMDLYKFMIDKYGEKFNLNYQVMRRHYRDFQNIVEQSVKASGLRERVIQDQIFKDIETVRIIRKNLGTLKNQLTTVGNKNLANPKERKEVRDIVNTINKTLELLLRYSDKIEYQKPNLNDDELIRKILQCFEGIPSEYQMMFIKKWRENFSDSKMN